MNHLHHEFDAAAEDLIEVTLNGGANVQLMDSVNYENYRNGRPFHYYGGYATRTPVLLSPPRAGHWHLVVDLGGYPGSVRAEARIIPKEAVGSAR